MPIRFQGGCACGAIRYDSSVDPQFSFHCQCRQCQCASGTERASLFTVPADALTVKGELKFHDQKADSGNTISRGFCPACGSTQDLKKKDAIEAVPATVDAHFFVCCRRISWINASRSVLILRTNAFGAPVLGSYVAPQAASSSITGIKSRPLSVSV